MHTSTGILVAALLALTGCAGAGSDSVDAGVAVQPTVGAGPGHLLLEGDITRNGAPETDAEVWVSVLADAAGAEVGDVVPTWESDVVSADDDGRFALSVDEDELSSVFFNGDFLNFQINVLQDGDWATWNTTAYLVRAGAWRTSPNSLVADPVAEASFDLGAATLTLTDSDGQSQTSTVPVRSDAGDAVLPHAGG